MSDTEGVFYRVGGKQHHDTEDPQVLQMVTNVCIFTNAGVAMWRSYRGCGPLGSLGWTKL